MSIPSIVNGTLSSIWDGLSEHLIAQFYEVGKGEGGEWARLASSGVTVCAALTEANMEITLNWQSPFEQAGAEARMPALMAMLQSGELQPVLDAIGGATDNPSNPFRDQFKAGVGKLSSSMRSLEGRTGITKLNSTQVFSGMPPVKITATALFRAWKDAAREVEAPFDQLMAWALPQELASDSTVISRGLDYSSGNGEGIDVLMPSKAPVRVGMRYKGRTFSPLVIESIGMPLGSAIDASGRFVELAVPITLCTLTALDRNDWSGMKHGI